LGMEYKDGAKKNNSQQLDRYHFYAIFKKVKINAKISMTNRTSKF